MYDTETVTLSVFADACIKSKDDDSFVDDGILCFFTHKSDCVISKCTSSFWKSHRQPNKPVLSSDDISKNYSSSFGPTSNVSSLVEKTSRIMFIITPSSNFLWCLQVILHLFKFSKRSKVCGTLFCKQPLQRAKYQWEVPRRIRKTPRYMLNAH